MHAQGDGIQGGFLRQRRSLVAVSLVLLALQVIGAQLKQLTILGNTIELEHPVALVWPVWVAWGYFLLRYYQYFRDLGDTGFGTMLRGREEQLARKAAVRKLKTLVKPDVEGLEKPSWTIVVDPLLIIQEPPGFWQFQGSGTIQMRDRANPTKGRMQLFEDVDVVLAPGTPRLSRLRAIAWTLVHTRFGTEYGMPFVVAVLPAIVAGVRVLRKLLPTV